ncbi:MAG TPA: type VI secretion system contractile sheath large subunit [Pyrinomonadaceae bacterium]|nr:type VI secretion system contractile sheath large subunit [Pyrinomonadaceae bacterium]
MAKKEQAEAQAQVQEQVQESGLLDKILSDGRMARDDYQKERAKDMIAEYVRQVMSGEMTLSANMDATINARIAEIDRLITAQMNEIMHHQEFQKLEASWRGLHHLVSNSLTGTQLKIRVMSVTKKDLLKDFERALEFDQSSLFKKIYEEEYGTFGGAPYGALIGDFEFGNHPQDMALLERISQVAAAAHAPFISAASADLFGWDEFSEMTEVRDVSKIFDRTEFAKWRSFRESEDSRYVGLTIPHILMREPYGEATRPTETFNFEEDVDGRDHKKYLWGNAAYAMGTRLTEAFSMHGWCVAIRGVEGGGLVQGLPTHTFETDEGEVAMKCPTEVAITDRREKEFADNGFIPLVHCKNTDYAAFFATQSANKAKKYDTDEANANARLSSQLQYIFAVSRFAHYLKSMMRDKIGSFMSRQEAELFLNRWINNYVLENDVAPAEQKAKYPLREARIDVAEVPGKPGAYRAVAFLRPHFQLDELSVSLRLVADLPPPAK